MVVTRAQLANITDERDAVKAELANVKPDRDTAKVELAIVEAKYDALKDHFATVKRELDAVKTELSTVKADQDSARSGLVMARAERNAAYFYAYFFQQEIARYRQREQNGNIVLCALRGILRSLWDICMVIPDFAFMCIGGTELNSNNFFIGLKYEQEDFLRFPNIERS